MRKRKKSYPAVQFGTSLMLVVFITLCLTAFATLSLSSAMRDYEYSQRAADKTYDYYQADAMANEKLARIAAVLDTASQSARSDTDVYMEQVLTGLKAIPGLTVSESETAAAKVSYTVPVNDSQELQVALTLYTPDTAKDSLYQIARWREAASQNWNSTSTLPVIGSD